jgi:hypothetical protein
MHIDDNQLGRNSLQVTGWILLGVIVLGVIAAVLR